MITLFWEFGRLHPDKVHRRWLMIARCRSSELVRDCRVARLKIPPEDRFGMRLLSLTGELAAIQAIRRSEYLLRRPELYRRRPYRRWDLEPEQQEILRAYRTAKNCVGLLVWLLKRGGSDRGFRAVITSYIEKAGRRMMKEAGQTPDR
ncbi:MAG: hypothetical protein JSU73_02350 [candidate division WOR-3 bacterium]|nr:MAG: hypothetical protein JSU73_02350 [candidate division WOR-3 bacterium]